MARIEVPMPQMGESIAEGTVSKWLKEVGDAVERDEPILEISTDKVDAEIPAPASGTLVEIGVEEGETVEVGTVVAFIDTDAEASAEPEAAEVAEEEAGPAEEAAAEEAGAEAGTAEEETRETREAPAEAPAAEEREKAAVAEEAPEAEEEAPEAEEAREAEEDREAREAGEAPPPSAEERLRTRSTPVVRKIAEEHGVDIASVEGTGHAGRVTKQDIVDYIESGKAEEEKAAEEEREEREERPAAVRPEKPEPAPAAAPSGIWDAFYGEVRHPEFPVREADTVEPMNKIRRLTAEHMVLAKRVAPHVHSFIEVDFTRVDRIRRENRGRWESQGARVSFTAFVAWVCSRALREFPRVNGTVSGNNLVFRGNVNIGIAVDLDPGLIVPVIRDADELSLVGIAKRIADLAERARSRKLKPDEIQGTTFSITNPGVLGTLVGMPVIPKGTAAILGTGAIEKRPVVLEDPETGSDSIAVRKRALFSLGYDHRIVDGADAARFLARVKELVEAFPEDA